MSALTIIVVIISSIATAYVSYLCGYERGWIDRDRMV